MNTANWIRRHLYFIGVGELITDNSAEQGDKSPPVVRQWRGSCTYSAISLFALQGAPLTLRGRNKKEAMKPETPTDLPAAVWNILQFNYGESNRITKKAIADEIYGDNSFDEDGNLYATIDRNIRDAVAGLVTNNHRPIVATSDGAGYFVARNMNEASHAIAELDSRIGALQARKRGIIAGLTGGNAGQGTLL